MDRRLILKEWGETIIAINKLQRQDPNDLNKYYELDMKRNYLENELLLP